eukprot:scaffold25176_cov30-Tisochrysis_lutea.AAC.4
MALMPRSLDIERWAVRGLAGVDDYSRACSHSASAASASRTTVFGCSIVADSRDTRATNYTRVELNLPFDVV